MCPIAWCLIPSFEPAIQFQLLSAPRLSIVQVSPASSEMWMRPVIAHAATFKPLLDDVMPLQRSTPSLPAIDVQAFTGHVAREGDHRLHVIVQRDSLPAEHAPGIAEEATAFVGWQSGSRSDRDRLHAWISPGRAVCVTNLCSGMSWRNDR